MSAPLLHPDELAELERIPATVGRCPACALPFEGEGVCWTCKRGLTTARPLYGSAPATVRCRGCGTDTGLITPGSTCFPCWKAESA